MERAENPGESRAEVRQSGAGGIPAQVSCRNKTLLCVWNRKLKALTYGRFHFLCEIREEIMLTMKVVLLGQSA